jgi:hypothetical protein
MSSSSKACKGKKRASADAELSSNKKQDTGNKDVIWVDTSNKISWVWKYFKLATDGRTYCFYIETINEVEKTCNFSCIYNSQTSSMNYHLNSAHKVYEKKKMVCTINYYRILFI